MKIALLQINPTVGDLTGNAQLIADAATAAGRAGAALAVTPELALAGYLPRDLLLSAGFVDRCWDVAAQLARSIADGPAVLVGLPEPNPSDEGRPLFNTAVLLQHGRLGARFRKALLPTYDVFDEDRYFEPRSSKAARRCWRSTPGQQLAHQHLRRRLERSRLLEAPPRFHHFDPIEALAKGRRTDDHQSLPRRRSLSENTGCAISLLGAMAAKHHVPVLYVNQAGGNDDLLFDGRSSAFSSSGQLIARGRAFAPDVVIVDLGQQLPLEPSGDVPAEAEIWDALVLGTRDYMRKCGFASVVLGLSGGVDSALTAAIAAEAVGPEHVLGVLMPSPYSSQGSIDDALELAKQLGIATQTLPIETAMNAMDATLEPAFYAAPSATSPKKTSRRASGAIC